MVQKKYVEATGKLNDLLNKQTSSDASASSKSRFLLPKLELPMFHGKETEWKSFISLFDRMVHNNTTIDDGLKVEYLKTCIKGEAFKIIKHIDPWPENYNICYGMLRKRYDNPRNVLGKLLDNILNIPIM